jgi:hypothetical protein
LAKKLSVWFGNFGHIKDITTLSPLFDGGKRKRSGKKETEKDE